MSRPDVPVVRRRRQWAPDARALGIVGDRWILLIVRELAFGRMRFSELQRTFPGMSTGALEQRMSRMMTEGLVTRRRYAEVPPRVEFELTAAGRELLPVLPALVRWALRWAWSEPAPDEWVDVAAMFRLAGFVLTPPPDLRSELELIVEDRQQVALDLYAVRMADGVATVAHRPAERADAVIKGTGEAWTHALGPARAFDALRVDGDPRIAELFLAGFQPAPDATR